MPSTSGSHATLALALWLAVTSSVAPAAFAAPKGTAMQVAQRLAAEAKEAYMARDYGRAADLYAEALKNVEHERLFFTYGRSLEQLGQFKTAGYAYGRAVALATPGAERNAMSARAAANAKLDEAQQRLVDGQAGAAQPMAQSAHRVLSAQSKRAEDGEVYPEPASVLLLLARIELALGNHAAAQQLLVEVRTDPTAPESVVGRARDLAAGAPGAKAVPTGLASERGSQVSDSAGVVGSKDTARDKPVVEATAAQAESGEASPQVTLPAVPQPAAVKSVAAWASLGVSAAVALAGGLWWGLSTADAHEMQAKIDRARADGSAVEGVTQQDYAAAKVSADRGYGYGSAMVIAGVAGLAGSVLWLALAGNDSSRAAPAVGVTGGAHGAIGLALSGHW